VRVVVFGAAGRTGLLIVERALGHGHDVTAFAHDTPIPLDHPRLAVLAGDVLDFDAVSAAMDGQRAVASALGVGGRGTPRLLSDGIANIIHAMAVHEVTKLSAVSAAGTFARSDPNLSLGFRMMISVSLRSVYDDLERMEQRIMASDLDWTIVRPYGLSDGPQTGRYRMTKDGSLLPKASRISRADVAAVALTALETDEYARRILTIAD
jgi:putative NADH-flavin reductase